MSRLWRELRIDSPLAQVKSQSTNEIPSERVSPATDELTEIKRRLPESNKSRRKDKTDNSSFIS
jgi:hypothetical protein